MLQEPSQAPITTLVTSHCINSVSWSTRSTNSELIHCVPCLYSVALNCGHAWDLGIFSGANNCLVERAQPQSGHQNRGCNNYNN